MLPQNEEEIRGLIARVKSAGVTSFLEIGSKFGGSFDRIVRAMPPNSWAVSVDITRRPHLDLVIAALCFDGYRAIFIEGDSKDTGVGSRVRSYGPFDAVFIDGDHSSLGVNMDWKFYGNMATKMVVFHDIKLRTCGVPTLWNRIKENRRYEEIVADTGGKLMGIGIIWID